MDRIWILDSGEVEEKDLIDVVKQYIQDNKYYVAYACDAFYSGICSGKEDIVKNYAELLELRIFDEHTEFMARRSTIGHKFVWRKIDDRELDKRYAGSNDPSLPPMPEMLFIDEEQTLDINTEKSVEREGVTEVISTTGGRYTLPVKNKEGSVKTRIYLSYDKDGMATAEDYRLCGFN